MDRNKKQVPSSRICPRPPLLDHPTQTLTPRHRDSFLLSAAHDAARVYSPAREALFDFGAEKACVCLNDDRVPDGTEITLTPFDDCARVAGSELYLYADDGADVVEAVGDYVYLDGGWGDDTLSATGGYNYVVGQGGVDTCFNGGEGGCTCEIKDCGDDAP